MELNQVNPNRQTNQKEPASSSNVHESQLFWSFDIPLVEVSFERSLRLAPGCIFKSVEKSLSCSSMTFYDLTLFLQWTEEPHLLSLLKNRENSFVAEYLFDTYSRASTIFPFYISRSKQLVAKNPEIFHFKTDSFFNISPQMGLDVSSALPALRLGRLPLRGRLSVSMELNFGKWKLNQTTQVNSISLLSLSLESGVDLFELTLEQSPTNAGGNSGYSFKIAKLINRVRSKTFQIPEKIIKIILKNSSEINKFSTENSFKQDIQNRPSSSAQALTSLAQNLRLTTMLQEREDGSLHVHLFVLQPKSSLDDDMLQVFEGIFENSNILKKPVNLTLLRHSPTGEVQPPIENLSLSRVILSESVFNLWHVLVFGPQSRQFSKCRSKCLVESPVVENSLSGAQSSCWQCSDNLVYDPRIGECQPFCFFQTKNVFGNCLECFYQDCSDSAQKLEINFELKNNRKIISASDGFFDSSGSKNKIDFYKEHFDLFRIEDGVPEKKVNFSVRSVEKSKYSAEIIPENQFKQSQLATKNAGYRIALKPDRNAISGSRTLYHHRHAILTESTETAFLREMNPIYANVKRQVPEPRKYRLSEVSSNVSAFNKDNLVDGVYSKCTFNDAVMENLARALFILICIGNGLYLLFSLFVWNRTLVYKLPTLATVLFVHMNCLYQAAIFCLLYESSLPPALDSFLRHSYRFAIRWHGAFGGYALDKFKTNPSFSLQYFRSIVPRRLALNMVQNLLLNFGVILVVWAVVWLLAGVLYTIIIWNPNIYLNHFDGHFEWKKRSCLNRLSMSFAFKLACLVWLVFSVEFSFFFTYDMILPLNQHELFKVSFALSIILMLFHFSAVIFLLYLPSHLSEFLGKIPQSSPAKISSTNKDANIKKLGPNDPNSQSRPAKPQKTDTLFSPNKVIVTTKKRQRINTINLDRGSIHFRHLALVTSQSYAKYHFLFALQGLRTRMFGVGHFGITALIFSFYGVIISAAYALADRAVVINFILILALLVFLIISDPGFYFVTQMLLIAAYFVFLVAKLFVALYIYEVFQGAGGRIACDFGLAVVALLFGAIGLLLIGLLLSLCLSFKLKKRFEDLFKNSEVRVSTLQEPTCLLPDDDNSIIDPSMRSHAPVQTPLQKFQKYQEGRSN